jgi:HAD superfamily hydrolase (TIGR01662 family)
MIIFDVDGTLTPQRPTSRSLFERRLLPGVAEKCANLRRRGHILVLASNQGGARRGREGRLTFGAVHAHLRWLCNEIGAGGYRFATRPPRGKPSPAMLLELMAEFGISANETMFVGDSNSDEMAAVAAGVAFVHADEFFGRRD